MQVIVTNTIYETFLMFLLGYGLAQYPRHLWMQSNLDLHLLRTQMRASAAFKAMGESQLNVSLVVADVMKTKAEVHTRKFLKSRHSDSSLHSRVRHTTSVTHSCCSLLLRSISTLT